MNEIEKISQIVDRIEEISLRAEMIAKRILELLDDLEECKEKKNDLV